MNFFIREDEVADFYLEKPISEKEIQSLMTLLNIPHITQNESWNKIKIYELRFYIQFE